MLEQVASVLHGAGSATDPMRLGQLPGLLTLAAVVSWPQTTRGRQTTSSTSSAVY